MPSVQQCNVCEHFYDGVTRQPLCLPCGHIFCKTCLETPLPSPRVCAICRAAWKCSVDALPACLQLVPDPSRSSTIAPVAPANQTGDSHAPGHSCKKHNFVWEFWCSKCFRELCKKCLLQEHKFCDTVLIEDVLNESSRTLVINVAQHLKENLTADVNSVQSICNRNRDSLTQVIDFLSVIQSMKVKLESEKISLRNRKDDIGKMLNNVTSASATPTRDGTCQMLRWATEYRLGLEKHYDISLSDAQLEKLEEVCCFARDFKFPNQQQQRRRRGGFARWIYYSSLRMFFVGLVLCLVFYALFPNRQQHQRRGW